MARRRTIACALGLTLLATGCTDGETGSTRPVTVAPSSAVAVFGQAGVRAAVKEALAFTFGAGWSPHLIATHVDALTVNSFAPIMPYLTPSAGQAFSTVVTGVVRHDKTAIRRLEGAVFFGIKGVNGSRPVDLNHLVTDRKYSRMSIGVDTTTGQRRMSITFRATATIHLRDAAGHSYALPTSRRIHLLLVPATASSGAARRHPFLIAGWRSRSSAGRLHRTA